MHPNHQIFYLRHIENDQERQKLLHLQTNKVVKQINFTKIPITPSIIKQVHNTTKWMKTSQPIFNKNQTNFRSHMKLRKNKKQFLKNKKIMLMKNYSKTQRKTMIQKMNNKYRQKRMINMVKRTTIKSYVETKESEYRHKGGNIYKQEQIKQKNVVRSHHIKLR